MLGLTLLLAWPATVEAADFDEELARIDEALAKSKANPRVLESCVSRRNAAVRLYETRQFERAERSLRYCAQILNLPDVNISPTVALAEAPPTMDEIQAAAAREVEKALTLTPDVENGLQIYRTCAACHMREGWGHTSGSVPQIAGQLRPVIIKQLADIRAGNRDNPRMAPYSSVENIGGTQAVADVAGYIDTLEMSVANGKGPEEYVERGEKLYAEYCARCHGANGEGDAAAFVPRIQAQHFRYLLRQFEWIRDGKRRNANPYVSRLLPPEDLRAPPGWKNPDFVK
jgi:cytochrome c553